MVEACGALYDQRPDLHLPPLVGTNPPPPSLAAEPTPPSRESTPTTVAADETSFARSRSIGADSSHWGQRVPPLPMILSPWRGPVHERLREKSFQRFFDSTERDAEAAEAAEVAAAIEAAEAAAAADAAAEAAAEAAQAELEVGVHPETEDEEVPETDLDTSNPSKRKQCAEPRVPSSGPFAPGAPRKRTYGKTRSHAPSPPEPEPQRQSQSRPPNAAAAAAEVAGEDAPLPGPNSPRLSAADLVRRERARMYAAKMNAELEDRGFGRPHRIYAEATQPPSSRPQPRPPPGGSGSTLGAKTRGTRRLDPLSAARNDMIKFNEVCAQERATSFVRSATRQPKPKNAARGAAPAPRPRHELLPDNEEEIAEAEARANGRWPVSLPNPIHKVYWYILTSRVDLLHLAAANGK